MVHISRIRTLCTENVLQLQRRWGRGHPVDLEGGWLDSAGLPHEVTNKTVIGNVTGWLGLQFIKSSHLMMGFLLEKTAGLGTFIGWKANAFKKVPVAQR